MTAATGGAAGPADFPARRRHADAALRAVLAGLPLLRATLQLTVSGRPTASGGAGESGAGPLPPSPAGATPQPPDGLPADRRLAEYFRGHPTLGRRDRGWIADRVFDVLRNARLYAAWPGEATGAPDALPGESAESLTMLARRLLGVSLLGEGPGRDALTRFAADCPPAIRYSLPDWLWQRFEADHGEQAGAIAAALLEPATTDLRCNLLRAKPAALVRRLADDGLAAAMVAAPDPASGPWSRLPSTALRLAGRPALESVAAFREGWFEVQDAGSQWIADAFDARRGEVVIDFCAGAGGKALALAARMRNTGQLLAFDSDGERLARLAPRAQRAGVSIITTLRIDGADDVRLARYQGKADCVLVDAPCAGSGTLRRAPDLKWRYQPADIERLNRLQLAILTAAARLVRPDGRLVYATCSLLAAENTAIAAAFESAWSRSMGGRPLAAVRAGALLPDDGQDGFFVAKWLFGRHQEPGPSTIQ